MKASKNAHDWHCEDHDTYGWRGEACLMRPKARGETEMIEQLKAENAEWKEKAKVWMASPEAAAQLDGYRELGAKVAALEAENSTLRGHIEQLREAVEEGLSTYKVPMTARICEAITALAATDPPIGDRGILDGSNRTTGGWIGQP